MFDKWQIYNNEPGWANTYNSIESFDASIKRDFFKRKRPSVFGAIIKLEEILAYYSEYREFHTYPKYEQNLHMLSLSKTKTDYKSNGKNIVTMPVQ